MTVKTRNFITFGKPDISEEEIEAVLDVLKSGWIGTGQVATDLENEFVYHMGSGFGVAVSSCTIGLAIALKAAGVCKGEDVMTSPLTFAATVNAIFMVGARPVFVDVDEVGCLNFGMIDRFKTPRLSAIVPIHYTGASANMGPINREAQKLKISVIEDAAHSFGGSYLGQKQGSFGDIGVFSFYATKNITSGEGGMIYTKKRDIADRCRVLSQNGQSSGAWGRYSKSPVKRYQVLQQGFKGNLPDLLAAIGLVQLKRWPELKKKRDKVWKIYEASFGRKEFGHSKHLYTVRIKDRDTFREKLYERGIGTGIHYDPVHLEPAYSVLGYRKGDFPIAEKIGRETVSLPLSNCMTEEEAEYVVKEVKKIGGLI